jgi:hypothetical protein
MRPLIPLLIPMLIATVLAGCGERTPATPAAPEPTATEPAAPGRTEASMPRPPVVEPAPAADVGMLPAAGTITFAGFGPAAFGSDEESVRMAWGKDMAGAPSEPGGCYVLVPAPRGEPPFRFGFMLEGGKFSRIDVRIDAIPAPGGGKVGMSANEIVRLYPGAEETPHKYTPGARTLRAKDPAGGAAALVFETGTDGVVVAWRIGVAPQVDYVEGCG